MIDRMGAFRVISRQFWRPLIGVVVGVVWGAVLIASLVPHSGISWQAHACGGVAGVIVAWRLSHTDRAGAGKASGATEKPGTVTVV